ncbi:MAG: hypothetical protein ACI4K7_09445 [Oscillospiraceae bacterium]
MSELVAAEDTKAIGTLGYSYYGGNDIYPCDWNKSRDCFLKLMEMDNVDDLQKCYYANTLGYIYYYGRCNDSVPEYDKAYKYFSIGAAGGIYESIYKLSDMYIHGYGTTKNNRAAKTLVDMVYEETAEQIIAEKYDCKFADAALRKGNLCRDGVSSGNSYDLALLCIYCSADCDCQENMISQISPADLIVYLECEKMLRLIFAANYGKIIMSSDNCNLHFTA